MSLDLIQKALDTRFQTLPGLVTSNVAWTNVDFSPPNNTQVWWEPTISSVNRRAAGAGVRGTVYWSGNYQINIRTRRSGGASPINKLMDAVMDHFPKGLSLPSGDPTVQSITLMVPSPRPAYPDAGWVLGVVIVPWYTYEFPA